MASPVLLEAFSNLERELAAMGCIWRKAYFFITISFIWEDSSPN
ncbi:MAG: hypothetical protein JWO08_1617 [Verrucomicrobiaceae bacterium]|nr:hypothetical protein [Verrucomicrobiaceae bacterium]